ncbi:MSS116 [Candida pseudojiufengensis]|uniref:MSS116 n=1 Tax=Candida pseudojiufengensis TaxID=497109 RepID=UPI00222442C4|nr:MSS116 [Candida pseudojiufengensis]KAI5963338.1 MSS116 [Candida pseudojiufengensis]
MISSQIRSLIRRSYLLKSNTSRLSIRSFHYSKICLNTSTVKPDSDATTFINANKETIQPINKEPTQLQAIPKEKSSTQSSSDEPFVPVKFSDFKNKKFIHPTIIEALEKAEFENLTPIQQQALIPIIQSEKGVVCRAKTGTGKTLTFLIPTVESAVRRISKNPNFKGVDSVIVAPTRDLALQIRDEYGKVCRKIPKKLQPRVSLIIGGQKTTFNPRSPSEIVITTPGRLEADLKDKRFSQWFKNVSYRVYDEADRLLDVGFEPQLNSIDRILKRIREEDALPMKSLLFSATVDDSITRFAQQHINRKYDYINTVPKNEPEVHENVTQILYKCKDGIDKFQSFFKYVISVIKNEKSPKIILFLPTQTAVEWFYEYLDEAANSTALMDHYLDFGIYQIHGGRTAYQRKQALKNFKDCRKGLLITTDVAARGIDVKGVTHVLQLYPSSEVADYVHKVGRTGRNGELGKAVLFTTETELPYVQKLKRERGVKFKETLKSGDDESTKDINMDEIMANINPNLQSTNEFFFTFMGYILQIKSVYRLDGNDLIEDNVLLYRTLIKDDYAKLNIQSISKSKRHLDRSLVRDYFEHKSDAELDEFREEVDRTSHKRAGRFNLRSRDDESDDRYGGRSIGGGNRSYKRNSFNNDRRDNQYKSNDRKDSGRRQKRW